MSQVELLSTFTATATGGTGNLTVESSSLMIPGYNKNQAYRVYSGDWDHTSGQTRMYDITGWDTLTAGKVFIVLIGVQKTMTIATDASHSGDNIISSEYSNSCIFSS